MKTVKLNELKKGMRYRLVNVVSHPFGSHVDTTQPFELVDIRRGVYVARFKEGAQIFTPSWVEHGNFAIAYVPVPEEKLTPQCQRILRVLKAGHTITQRSALMDFGIMALPRRIADLKEAGYAITSTMQKSPLTGQRYAQYTLDVQ